MTTGVFEVFSGPVKRFFGFNFIFCDAIFLLDLLLQAGFKVLNFGFHIMLHEVRFFQFPGKFRVLMLQFFDFVLFSQNSA